MGWGRTLSLLAIVLLTPVAGWARAGLRAAPNVQLPVGVESRGATLPGQRQVAPIFGYPSPLGSPANSEPQSLSTSPSAAVVTPPSLQDAEARADLPEPKPLAESSQPKATAEATPPSQTPAATRPAPNPFQSYSHQLRVRDVTPERAYSPLAPESMEAPSSLMPAGTPTTPGFNLGTLHRGCEANPFPAGIPGMPGASYQVPGGCAGGCCGANGNCAGCAPPEPYWFGAVGGLYMGRTSPNQVWLSQQRSDPSNRLMSGADAAAPWTGGWEASIGRIVPGSGGVQLTYWGLAPTSAFSSVRLPGDLGTPINFCNFEIGGICAADFFDIADEHRVWRRDQVNNVELNFFSGAYSSPIGACQISWLAGVRYFNFRDQLIFGSVEEGFNFGDNGGANEAYLNIATNNNLIGAQIGAWANLPVGSRLGLFLFPRVGIYANQANQSYQVYRGDGVSAFAYNTNKTSGSLLAQIDVGVSYALTPRWSAYLGYRVVAVSGIGLADNQIPASMIATPNVAAISSNGDLILQGGTAGLLWRF